jgi:hypothetical protein
LKDAVASRPAKKPRQDAFALLMASARVPQFTGWSLSAHCIARETEARLVDWVLGSALFLDDARKVRNFGLAWKQGGGHDLKSPFRPIPGILRQLWEDARQLLPASVAAMGHPNQVALKRYHLDGAGRYASTRPADVLGYHSDCKYNNVEYVVGVSLLSDSYLHFRRHGGHTHKEAIPRRTVYSMTGDALKIWTHALFEIRSPGRLSVTFRLVRA